MPRSSSCTTSSACRRTSSWNAWWSFRCERRSISEAIERKTKSQISKTVFANRERKVERNAAQFRLDDEAVADLRHDVARISEPCLLTLPLLGEFGLGVRGRAVRLIAALLAVKMALAVAPRRWRVTRTV